MYKLVKKIHSIQHSFDVLNDVICYNTTDEKIVLFNISTNKITFEINDYSSLISTFNKQYFYYDNKDNYSNLINHYKKEIKKLGFEIIKSNNNFILVNKRIDDKVYMIIMDINFNILYQEERRLGKNVLLLENHLFFTHFLDDTKFTHYIIEKDTARPLWQFDLLQLGSFKLAGNILDYKVISFVGIWKNMLWVQLNNTRLIALDINNGEKLFDQILYQTLNLPHRNLFISMHLKDDKLHWLAANAYVQIDLKTLTPVLKKDYYSLPDDKKIFFSHSSLQQDKLYFTGKHGTNSFFPYLWGVFDIQKNEILWLKDMRDVLEKKDFLKNEAPKVSQDKVYVLTHKGLLHIFEKQTDEQV